MATCKNNTPPPKPPPPAEFVLTLNEKEAQIVKTLVGNCDGYGASVIDEISSIWGALDDAGVTSRYHSNGAVFKIREREVV